ncbi:hypothetical protein [Chondromyces crocatus]|uniref:Zinc ribbon domain-containing protein n=1 Tax=Chondromyces crocatus TaxID=52 RepID=A0A0K1E6D1_CHOCO|nr:hypothetical protein [Chondromyces crocatus]AKT36435.1 uncharacterized protein CMC5_005480 [Chondromyces crocatus]
MTKVAKIAYPIFVFGGCLLTGYFVGTPLAVLVLASGALIGVILLFWASLRTLLGETSLSGADAYAIGAPRAEEEQKQAVLRALKDLEFERSVGKISEEDYRELVSRFRADAKRLLRILDEDSRPRREQVEALVAQHLRRSGLDGDAKPQTSGVEPEEKDLSGSPQGLACLQCSALNDTDAIFCKKCGARQTDDEVQSRTVDEQDETKRAPEEAS